MVKTFKLNFSQNKSTRLTISYPDFKREGLGALFTILDWFSYITIFSFFVFSFLFSSSDIFRLIYSSAVILFAVQLIRVILGGFGYYPKTVLDIGGLVFVALTIIAILFSTSQTNSLFGEGKLSFLSGINSFAFLLVYYFVVSQTIFAKSTGFINKLMSFSIFVLGLKLIGSREVLLEKEISSAFYLPILIPFSFFAYLSTKKAIFKIFSFVIIILTISITNFNHFSFSFSLLVSLFFFVFLSITLGSEFLFKFITSLGKGLGELVKGKNIFEVLWRNGTTILGFIGFFSLLIFSIVKSVENFSNNFREAANVFSGLSNEFSNTKELLFGKGLGSFSGSFYIDILNSFGVIGGIGLLFLLLLSFYYLFKSLTKSYKEKKYEVVGIISGVLLSYITLVGYFIFESVTVYGVILLWFILMLIGSLGTNALYIQDLKLNNLWKIKNSRSHKFFEFLRIISILFVFVVGIISVYLILNK